MKKKTLRKLFITGAAVFFTTTCAFLLNSDYSLAKSKTDVEVEIENGEVNSAQGTAEVNISVENNGDDFGGYVRLLIGEDRSGYNSWKGNNVAYDTYVSVAGGSTESIKLSFSKINGMNLDDVSIRLQLLDEKGNVLSDNKQRKIFDDSTWYYGIISDTPDEVSYLGSSNSTYWIDQNLDAKELDPDNMEEAGALSGIHLLVIDNYDVSQLSDQAVKNIESWVNSGGALVIGTGSMEDKTFSAFTGSMIDASVVKNGTTKLDSAYSRNNYGTIQCADIMYGNYANYGSKRPVADGYIYQLPWKSSGSGAVMLLPFSLCDNDLDSYYLASDIISELSSYINSAGKNEEAQIAGNFEDLFSELQGKNSVNLPLLRIVIVIYIALVGPVLYLILKKINKREKIWGIIPATALVFVGLIYLCSRGFGVSSKSLIIVRSIDANGIRPEASYIYGYNAKSREWAIKLDDDAYAAGPFMINRYYDYSQTDNGEPRIVASRTPKGISLSYRPREVFDGVCYRALSDPDEDFDGSMTAELSSGYSVISGTLINETGYDFDRVLVVCDGEYAIIDEVEDGEEVDIDERSEDFGMNSGYNLYSRLNSEARTAFFDKKYDECREIAALATAAVEMNGHSSFVIGVTRSKGSIVTSGEKKEIYACYYADAN
ncbi:MAG: hypothetical protein K6C99_07160 [Lachnospiraceae bacterium]|nr:hypothetical protein [Lachnospiraceae bacterium]